MVCNVNVWNEMDRLQKEMNGFLSQIGRSRGFATYPLTNAYEDADSLVVTAELPGMTKDNVAITFSDGTLVISGKQESLDSVKNMAPVRRERVLGAFEKTLRIPKKIDESKIMASFVNGILTVTLPKSEDAKPKTITIDAK